MTLLNNTEQSSEVMPHTLGKKVWSRITVFCPFSVVSTNRYNLTVSRREHRCLRGASDPGVFLGVTNVSDLSLLDCTSAHVEDKAMHLLPLTIGIMFIPSSLSDCPPLQRVFCHIPNGLACLDLETPCVYFRKVWWHPEAGLSKMTAPHKPLIDVVFQAKKWQVAFFIC